MMKRKMKKLAASIHTWMLMVLQNSEYQERSTTSVEEVASGED